VISNALPPRTGRQTGTGRTGITSRDIDPLLCRLVGSAVTGEPLRTMGAHR
jgi:hypothetical protein